MEHDVGELESPSDEAVLMPLLRTLAVRSEFFRTLHELTDHLDPATRAAVRLQPPARLDAEELQETVYADMMGSAAMPESLGAAPAVVAEAASATAPAPESERRSLRDVEPFLAMDVLAMRARDKDAIVCSLTDRIDDALIASCRNLKVVANIAVGYNNIDVAACTARGILATNTPGPSVGIRMPTSVTRSPVARRPGTVKE